ncbi:MAG: AraC family transcriptional regulator [Pseudomonadota bacterium]
MLEPLTTAIRVLPVAQLVAQGKWRAEAMHSYEAHTLIWFSKGQGRIVIAGTRAAFSANTIVFLPAGTAHAFEVKSGTFGTAALVRDHPSLEMPEVPILYRPKDLLRHGEFVSLFEAMQREANQPPSAASERACRCHAGILGVWLERQENQLKDAARLSASERLARRYAELLEVRYASGANVQSMAQELGVTATHLTRACQAAAGASAHQLLNDRLMYEARDLLAGTTIPVSRIAADLGFSSAAYFTRAFQKATGKTPSAFRTGS